MEKQLNRFRIIPLPFIRIIWLVFWGGLTFLPLWGENSQVNYNPDNFSVNSTESFGYQLNIIAEDIRVSFFPAQNQYRQGEKYVFQMTIENQSPDKPFNVRVFDEPFQQFTFTIVKENRHVTVKKLDYYRFHYNRKLFSEHYKQVEIEFQESFSKNISIDDFFELDSPGLYEIKGDFYPLGISEPDYRIPIQPFVLRVFPQENFSPNPNPSSPGLLGQSREQRSGLNQSTVPAKISDRFSGDTQIGSPRPLPLFPDEVVEDHFANIRSKNFSRYLNNLDLEKLLLNSFNTSELYLRFQHADVYEKKIILEDFKNFLLEKIDYNIFDSSILKTTVVDESAQVQAVIAVRQPFKYYHSIIDPHTGEIQDGWMRNHVENLTLYYLMNFDLEKKSLSQPDRWKITAYDSQKISAQQYKFYKERLTSLPVSTNDHVIEDEMVNNDYLDRTIYFDHNSFEVDEKYLQELNDLAQFLTSRPSLLIELHGHTDDLGKDDYNYELSKKRVESVKSLLLTAGVNSTRMRYFFEGEKNPITPGKTEYQRHLNRRVEIKILSPNSP